MKTSTTKNKISIQLANSGNIPILVSHYIGMFEEICVLQKINIKKTEIEKIGFQLVNNSMRLWIK